MASWERQMHHLYDVVLLKRHITVKPPLLHGASVNGRLPNQSLEGYRFAAASLLHFCALLEDLC